MTLTPFLMFAGEAEEAIRFYAVFPDAEIVSLEHYGPGEVGTEGKVKRAEFRIAGQPIKGIDSPVEHAFGFTPAISFSLDCTSEGELDELAARLSENGETLMPVAEYPFARRFAWLSDRYGVSWQLNVALE